MGMRGAARLASTALMVLVCGAGSLGHMAAEEAQAAPTPAPATRPHDFRAEFRQSLIPLPDAKTLTVRGTIYVPAYNSIRGNPGGRASGLSTLLRIDNTSSAKPLVIERIDYFDTSGKLVQRYLDSPIALKPFGAIQIFVSPDDIRGGPAANFIITWAGTAPMAEPLTEAVMFGSIGSDSYSFVSPGRAIRTVGKKHWFGFGLTR